MTVASVVIPAHNESAVIERCLKSLDSLQFAVVVVANGCTDDTAERARQCGVDVIELDAASKVAALNAGDLHCEHIYPRIYLDADIEVSVDHLQAVAQFLAEQPHPTVCAPGVVFDLGGASWLVRAFYKTYVQLPYMRNNMVGSGFYAVNASGRARWDSFPEVTADDLYVQGLFAAEDRVVLSDAHFTVRVPRTLSSLLRVRTRTYRGNAELDRAETHGSMAGSRKRSLRTAAHVARRHPSMVPSLFVFLAVNSIAAARARRIDTDSEWLTDTTSRTRA